MIQAGSTCRAFRKVHAASALFVPSHTRLNGHMTRQMTATDAKAKLLTVLDEVAAGDEVEITKHGRTVARLVPARGPRMLQGALKGMARTVADEDLLFTTGATWDLP